MPHLERRFVSREIRRQRREGKPTNQAVAIAFSKARRKFGDKKILRPRMSGHTNNGSKRTRRLITTLFGVAIGLALLRRITRPQSGHLKNRRSGHLIKRKRKTNRIRKRFKINSRIKLKTRTRFKSRSKIRVGLI